MQIDSSTSHDCEVWVLLHQVSDASIRAREKELAQFGLSFIESEALYVIQAVGRNATPAQISRWLYRRPHSISDLLKRMEKKGLVKKSKDLEKRNMVRVSLTAKGKRAYENSLKTISISRILEAIPKEDMIKLASYLKAIRDKAIIENGESINLPFP